jgi:two-component system sensor histidine kinase SenX3
VTIVGSVLLAIAAAALGVVVGLVVVPSLRARRAHAVRARTGLTVSEVLDRVVDSSENGIAVVDRFGDVVLCNPRAEELGVVHERRMDARAWTAVQRVFATREPVEVVLGADARPGRAPMAVIGLARPLGSDTDRFVVVEAADESERVRLDATRRDFVANVSHELKTPVGAMALLAEALLESPEDPEVVRHFASRILHESTRLGSLVTELIALSRLQGAEALPQLDVVDVDDVVAEALRRSDLSAEAAGIAVTVDRPSGLEVKGDRTLLVTALSNLVENAIAYSPPGSPVSVSRALRTDHVEVSVTDRGIGIPLEHQERVFERFFRVDPARSRVTGGTGLGLAIVKHVAANHDGGVRLWSRPGTGSTFTLRVPVHTEDVDDEVTPPRQLSTDGSTSRSRNGEPR